MTGPDPRPCPDVIAKRLDDAAVLVHLGTNRIFELNQTGMRVWELLGEGLGVQSIVRRLVDEFEVDETRAAGEVASLLERLRNEGLLTS